MRTAGLAIVAAYTALPPLVVRRDYPGSPIAGLTVAGERELVGQVLVGPTRRWRQDSQGCRRLSLTPTPKAPSKDSFPVPRRVTRRQNSAIVTQACRVLAGAAARPSRTMTVMMTDAGGRARKIWTVKVCEHPSPQVRSILSCVCLPLSLFSRANAGLHLPVHYAKEYMSNTSLGVRRLTQA